MTALFSPLIERARRVAARSHRNHHRKARDLPYITHLAGVALILHRAGFDDDNLIAAALLHDALEDTDYSLDELREEFPPAVVECVATATEQKQDSRGRKRSWRDRKAEHLEQVGTGSRAARTLVLADKLHNLGTMLYDIESGEELWSRFGAPPEELFRYYREMTTRAARDDAELAPLADSCRAFIERLEATHATGRT